MYIFISTKNPNNYWKRNLYFTTRPIKLWKRKTIFKKSSMNLIFLNKENNVSGCFKIPLFSEIGSMYRTELLCFMCIKLFEIILKVVFQFHNFMGSLYLHFIFTKY